MQTPSHSSAASTKSHHQQVQLHCDLAKEPNPFRTIGFTEIPVPVLTAFGSSRMHVCMSWEVVDNQKAVEENRDKLLRSTRWYRPKIKSEKPEDRESWDDFVIQLGELSFVCGDATRVYGFAASTEESLQIVKDFLEKYSKPSVENGGNFQLIKTDDDGIASEKVPLEAESLLKDDIFSLHYPSEFQAWHGRFVEKLKTTKKGLSIFQGDPGTGKTSYLRHLMGVLKETHRFYFVPPATMSILSHPKFVGFWARQRNRYSDKKLAVILEDADAALMTRRSDNRDEVSAILNLTDGMLGDFLSLQIICTINCPMTDIDQALLRPGRLIANRRFERLNAEQAERLATHLGKQLPQKEDYSLAEIFSEEEPAVVSKPRMGFGG